MTDEPSQQSRPPVDSIRLGLRILPPMKPRRRASRAAAYLWAAPNTLLGLVAGLALLGLGGRVELRSGAAEFQGGRCGRFFASLPLSFRFGAITLGHVILAVGADELAALREHEHAHVRQYERWGPFFLPAYALSSAWQVLRGRRVHQDNFFEQQARAGVKAPTR
jgi:hypothetical protein